jgi:hypothetical protein
MSTGHTALRRVWTRDSSILLGGFFVTIFLIVYICCLGEYFAYVDWSSDGGDTLIGLIGIFVHVVTT